MNKEAMHKLMRMGWILPLIGGLSLSFIWVFKMGVKDGRGELIDQLNQPELRITHLGRADIQLVMIEQRMAQGDLKRQRVEIDTSAINGLEAERLGSSDSGSYGFLDEVSLWRIVNSSNRDLPLTKAEFTNLPEGFRLPKNFEGDFIIPPNPKS